MEFSRQEYWSGLPFPTPGDLPNPEIKPTSLVSPLLEANSLPPSHLEWRRKWQSTPVLLPGKSHGQRSLVGYSLWGHKESDMTEQLHTFTAHSVVYLCECPMCPWEKCAFCYSWMKCFLDVNFIHLIESVGFFFLNLQLPYSCFTMLC